MVNSGVPAVTVSPSATSTSTTVPTVVMVIVSLLLALVRPLPWTVEVMEPYCTMSVTTSPSSLLLPPSTFSSTTAAITSSSASMHRRMIRRRFFRGIACHRAFRFTRVSAGAALSAAVSSIAGAVASCSTFSRSLTSAMVCTPLLVLHRCINCIAYNSTVCRAKQ